MREYTYLARSRDGKSQQGTVKAESRDEVLAILRHQGLLVLDVQSPRRWAEVLANVNVNPAEYRPMHSVDVEQNFHQLAVMLRAGLPLIEGVEIVGENSRRAVRKVWAQIKQRIQSGSSLSEAMRSHKVFTNFVVQLIKVGEQTGYLDRSLEQGSAELEERRRIRSQLIQALSYPVFVMLFAIGVAIFMLVKVIPELKKFLAILGRKLPPITQALIDVADWFEAYLPGILVGLVCFVTFVFLLTRFPVTRFALDTFLLRLPVLGTTLRLSGTVVFARSMSAMLKAGVRIVDALQITEELMWNRFLAHRIAQARKEVVRGSSLAEPLKHRHGFMPLLARMVTVGESSGNLDDMLEEMATYHKELLDKQIRTMTAMIAPVMVVVVGGIIGFVYAAFLVALFSAGGKPGG